MPHQGRCQRTMKQTLMASTRRRMATSYHHPYLPLPMLVPQLLFVVLVAIVESIEVFIEVVDNCLSGRRRSAHAV